MKMPKPKRRKERIKIPEDMVKRIHHMANATYQVIGSDLQACRAEMGEGGDMTREEVVEVVCDADHMETNGDDREAYEFWLGLSYEQAHEVVTEGFLFEYYE
jgi:hypothetical protein